VAISGRAVAIAAAGLVPVLLAPRLLVVAAWAGVLVLLCTVDLALAARPGHVRVSRKAVGTLRLTEEGVSELTAVNLSPRRLRAVVRDAWPPSAGATDNRHRLDIPPGEGRRLRTRLRPGRRGDLHADLVTVRSYGPLRLAARQASVAAPASLRVLPEFRSRRHLPSRLARLRELDGRSAVQIRGAGTEFDSLRTYVAGDDVRSIDWRATARRTEVVVRTWRPERDRRVLLVLDVSRLSAARLGNAPRLEAQLEAALLLAALAGHAGDRVELVAVDRTVRARVAAAGGPGLLSALATAVAPLTPALVELNWAVVTQVVRERLAHRSLVVLLTALEPAAVVHGLLPVAGALAHDHQVVLASAADPALAQLRSARGTTADLFTAAAAERALLEKEAAAGSLRRRGIEVVDSDPDELAPALSDAYLRLKAAGRL
jgi:uncharacterized protein (DUF58 family)